MVCNNGLEGGTTWWSLIMVWNEVPPGGSSPEVRLSTVISTEKMCMQQKIITYRSVKCIINNDLSLTFAWLSMCRFVIECTIQQ